RHPAWYLTFANGPNARLTRNSSHPPWPGDCAVVSRTVTYRVSTRLLGDHASTPARSGNRAGRLYRLTPRSTSGNTHSHVASSHSYGECPPADDALGHRTIRGCYEGAGRTHGLGPHSAQAPRHPWMRRWRSSDDTGSAPTPPSRGRNGCVAVVLGFCCRRGRTPHRGRRGRSTDERGVRGVVSHSTAACGCHVGLVRRRPSSEHRGIRRDLALAFAFISWSWPCDHGAGRVALGRLVLHATEVPGGGGGVFIDATGRRLPHHAATVPVRCADADYRAGVVDG